MKKQFRITLNGKSYDVVAEMLDEEMGNESAQSQRPARSAGARATAAAPAPTAKASPSAAGDGDVPSPLAGKVVSIDAAVGTAVTEGQTVITLEAMKMNTVVSAPKAGTVKAVHVQPGDSVEESQVLLTIS